MADDTDDIDHAMRLSRFARQRPPAMDRVPEFNVLGPDRDTDRPSLDVGPMGMPGTMVFDTPLRHDVGDRAVRMTRPTFADDVENYPAPPGTTIVAGRDPASRAVQLTRPDDVDRPSDAARRRATVAAMDPHEPPMELVRDMSLPLSVAFGPLGPAVGRGASWLGSIVRSSPRATAAATGAATAGIGGGSANVEAGDDAAGASRPQGDVVDRGVRSMVETGRNMAGDIGAWLSSADARFTPIDRDAFIQQRRSAPRSLQDAQNAAAREARNSQEYKAAIAKNQNNAAENIVRRQVDTAERQWRQAQSTVGGEEARLNAEYDRYVQGLKDQRRSHYDRSWQERYPAAGTIAGVASYVAPLALARRGFSKTAREGEDILARLASAKSQGEAAVLQRELELWRQTAFRRNAGVATKASLIPLEIRTGGNAWDATFLPHDAGAQARGQQHIKAMFGYGPDGAAGILPEVGPSLLSGITMGTTGSLLARRAPYNRADAAISTSRRPNPPPPPPPPPPPAYAPYDPATHGQASRQMLDDMMNQPNANASGVLRDPERMAQLAEARSAGLGHPIVDPAAVRLRARGTVEEIRLLDDLLRSGQINRTLTGPAHRQQVLDAITGRDYTLALALLAGAAANAGPISDILSGYGRTHAPDDVRDAE